jgi:hypothetical protein
MIFAFWLNSMDVLNGKIDKLCFRNIWKLYVTITREDYFNKLGKIKTTIIRSTNKINIDRSATIKLFGIDLIIMI